MLNSVLRYPGGKTRAIKVISNYFPTSFREYREPFVGGGAVFLYIKQKINGIERFWINDINEDLQLLWLMAKERNQELVDSVFQFMSQFTSGRDLFYYLRDLDRTFSDLERAARFFILNRTSFSGTTEAGGYSEAAFKQRLTPSSIQRLSSLRSVLENTLITQGDYYRCISQPGENVFVYLDPPYYTAKKSRLYGKNGCNHLSFDFDRLADSLRNCTHKWLMTLDNCDYVRNIFGFANTYEWDLQYGMNNVNKRTSSVGKELLICNYEVNPVPHQQLLIDC